MVESIKELRKICYSGKTSVTKWISKVFYMKFTIYITKLLLYTPITANQITMAMLIISIIGSVFLFNGFFITGLLLLHFAYILDHVDGEVARYRKESSMLGMYIDEMYHTIVNPFMVFGFAYGIYTLHPNKLLIIFGFLSAMFSQSVVVPSIIDTIFSMKIRGEKIPKISSKSKSEEVIEYEGKTKQYKNPILKVYHLLRELWVFPSNLIMLTLLYVWEVFNLKYAVIPEFTVSVLFFIIYGSFVTFTQIASFTFHTKKNSIDSFYVFLFGKK